MNLFRLLAATLAVFSKHISESDDDYGRRILLSADRVIRLWQLFQQGVVDPGSEPKFGEVLQVYRKLEQEATRRQN